MVAIYGVLGDAGRAELQAMAARLAHRGAFGAHWSPAPGVWFGMQSRAPGELATEGSLLLDGVLDNAAQLARRDRDLPTASPATPRCSTSFSRPKESARSSVWPVLSPLRGGGTATER
jgi:hypothetical protein